MVSVTCHHLSGCAKNSIGWLGGSGLCDSSHVSGHSKLSAMAFRGWPAEAIEFYEGLLADNTRTYWQAHRTTYDEKVRAPMVELLAELEPKWGAGKIFRPYRDVRFSADKMPYKTAIGAMLEKGGYVQISADGL